MGRYRAAELCCFTVKCLRKKTTKLVYNKSTQIHFRLKKRKTKKSQQWLRTGSNQFQTGLTRSRWGHRGWAGSEAGMNSIRSSCLGGRRGRRLEGGPSRPRSHIRSIIRSPKWCTIRKGKKGKMFFEKRPSPASFCLFLVFLKQLPKQFLKQINVKKCPIVHPVYGARIQTHDL